MSSQPSLKLYVSRGIQTDLTLVTQPSCSCNAQSKQLNSVVNCEPPTPGLESPSELSHGQLESSILVCEGAYTQYSRTSNVPKLGPSRQKQKPSSIGYYRPIGDLTPSRRVVSFPSSGPQAEVPLERKLRIVSMPEVGKDGTLISYSMQNDPSFASNASHNSSPKEVMNHIHTYPSDLPRTPSPPSSPDSVMIVGNDSTQVSTSFLRHSYADDDGWITWASSPPRPIPALHGPLSLPYARCPSGAEGTLVEGNDLPHRIWGLGIDNVQGSSRAVNRAVPLQSSGPTSNYTPALDTKIHLERIQNAKTMTLHSHRDAVIDLSKPSTFHSCADESTVHLRVHSPITYAGMCLSDTTRRNTLTLPPSAPVIDVDLPGVWRRDCSKTKLSSEHYVPQPSETGYASGLGTSGNNNNQYQLNKSAPLFIPGPVRMDGRSKSAYIQPPEEYEKFDSHSLAFPEATRAQQEQPASPSTCSPGWSPVFPGNPVEVEFARNVPSKHALTGSQYYDPKVFSPHPDIDEHSSRLLAMIQQVGNQDFDNVRKSYPGDSREPLNSYFSGSSPIDPYDKEQVQCKEPRLSDHSRKFSYQPRSIPLARLIQRRLSAVTEEDSVSRRGPAPLLQKSDHYSESKQLSPEAIVPTEDVVSHACADPNTEPTQNTISFEAIPDDRGSNAVVKLPRRSVNSSLATRQSNNQSRCDTTAAVIE